jgi:hypothetical protein
MKRRNKPLWKEGFRKKCSTCGSIKQVQHRKVELLPSSRAFNPKETTPAHELPGAVVSHYCSVECAGDDYINNYTDENFYRL